MTKNKKVNLYSGIALFIATLGMATIAKTGYEVINEDPVVTSFDEDLSAEVEDNAVSAQEDINDVESQDVLAGQQDDVLSDTSSASVHISR